MNWKMIVGLGMLMTPLAFVIGYLMFLLFAQSVLVALVVVGLFVYAIVAAWLLVDGIGL